jgi:hypothetical protein
MSGKTKKWSCPTVTFGRGPIISVHRKKMVLTSGTRSETEPSAIQGIAHRDTWKAAMKTMNMNCHAQDDGGMNPPIQLTSGFPIILAPIGGPTGMEDGYGIPSTVMCGHPMIPGDGIPIIMAAGIGVIIMAGTGFPATAGHRHGLAGSGMTIITDGAP